MATIVRRRKSDEFYVLIGTGLGAYRATESQWLFGQIAAEEDSDVLPVVAVSDAEGTILWIAAEEIEVVSVDGKTPAELVGAGAATITA